jgi:hypothetical protein
LGVAINVANCGVPNAADYWSETRRHARAGKRMIEVQCGWGAEIRSQYRIEKAKVRKP